MRHDDHDGLSPSLERRLRDELDRVSPRAGAGTMPRYLAAKARPLAWRLATAAVAVTLLSALAISGYAETGSANPVVWTRKVVGVVAPKASPAPPTPATTQPTHKPVQSAPSPPLVKHESPEPSQRPEPSESPEPTEAPEPTPSPEPRESPEPTDSPSSSGSGSSGSGER